MVPFCLAIFACVRAYEMALALVNGWGNSSQMRVTGDNYGFHPQIIMQKESA